MLALKAKLVVTKDGKIEGVAPAGMPAGEHDAVVVVDDQVRPAKTFRVADLPRHDVGLDPDISLRREDMYGDDGR